MVIRQLQEGRSYLLVWYVIELKFFRCQHTDHRRTGFSRGAYQVRVLSAMIDKVGLMHTANKRQTALYAVIRRFLQSSTNTSSVLMSSMPQTAINVASSRRRFREQMSRFILSAHGKDLSINF
jgi:hypothetical protein